MRALRIVGLADNGTHVVCEEPGSGTQYSLPADERLNAAARGDLSRLGQLENDMQTPLRPRDIQDRIRAGASVDELAAISGTEASKIDRFAYPVLMERGAVAEKARLAHPVIDGLPTELTVEQLVTRTLTERGQLDGLIWDAYREDAGQWVLLLRWTAGRSENSARWAYHARATGSTLTPHDETAIEIVDPAPRPLRTVRDLAAVSAPEPSHPMLSPTPQPQVDTDIEATPEISRTAVTAATKPVASPAKAGLPSPTGKKPAMPSWEDVLLGVRSSGH